MKKIALAVIAALSLSTAAFAHDNNVGQSGAVSGSLNVGAQTSTYTGNINGSATSISNGNAVTAAQVGGQGQSIQSAFNNTGGTSSVGGSISAGGATVGSNTTQYSNSQVTGNVSGNAPTMDGNSIANGGAAFGNTTTTANVGSSFGSNVKGGTLGINGSAAFQAVGAFGGQNGF